MIQLSELSPSFVKIHYANEFIPIHHFYSCDENSRATISLEVIFDQLLVQDTLPAETRSKIEEFSLANGIASILTQCVDRKMFMFVPQHHRVTKYEIYLTNVPQHFGIAIFTIAVDCLVSQISDITKLESSEIDRLYKLLIGTLNKQLAPK